MYVIKLDETDLLFISPNIAFLHIHDSENGVPHGLFGTIGCILFLEGQTFQTTNGPCLRTGYENSPKLRSSESN